MLFMNGNICFELILLLSLFPMSLLSVLLGLSSQQCQPCHRQLELTSVGLVKSSSWMQRCLPMILLHILEPSLSVTLVTSSLGSQVSALSQAASGCRVGGGGASHSTSPRNVTLHCAHTRRRNYSHFADIK